MSETVILNVSAHIVVMIVILSGLFAMKIFKKMGQDDFYRWCFCIAFSYLITILSVVFGVEEWVFVWAIQLSSGAAGMVIYDKVIEKWKKSNK